MCPRGLCRIRQAVVVGRQLRDVAEVLDVQIGRQCADEHRLLLEGIGEGVRNASWHDDDRASVDIDDIVTAGEAHLARRDDEDLVVIVMDVLGRPARRGLQRRLN